MSSLQVPSSLLRQAYLIGKTPLRACQSDQRFSYCLYVPEQYIGIHEKLQAGKIDWQQRMRLVVNVHGTRRDASLARDSLITVADSCSVAILSPLFPAGVDGVRDMSSYKSLVGKDWRADAVLISMIEEVASIWPGIRTDRFYLSGFSGGAQFAHRFWYLHPERVDSVFLGSPGSVSALDSTRCWPIGIADAEAIFAQSVEAERLQSTQVALYVGSEDTDEPDVRLIELLGARSALPVSRLLTATLYAEELRDKGIDIGFEIIAGIGHDYIKMVPTLCSLLESAIADDSRPASRLERQDTLLSTSQSSPST